MNNDWDWLYELDEHELLESRDRIVQYSDNLIKAHDHHIIEKMEEAKRKIFEVHDAK